ncbi:MAG: hypothetical protein LBM75_11680 [Myxococcales bacterium]|nr:hypothetical protein [Myxococcales bacterium]
MNQKVTGKGFSLEGCPAKAPRLAAQRPEGLTLPKLADMVLLFLFLMVSNAARPREFEGTNGLGHARFT